MNNVLLANKIRTLREQNGMLQRKVAAALDVDAGLYSKIERGERPAKREQVVHLVQILGTDEKELLTLWQADQFSNAISTNNNIAAEAIELVYNQYKANMQ